MGIDGLPPLTVGQFAAKSGLTAKALRHYDRIGLLRPAQVDLLTGYRRYSEEQVAGAQLIHVLRSLDVPLDQVAACLADTGLVGRTLSAHRQRLEARVTKLQTTLHRIDHLIVEGTVVAMPAEAPSLSSDEQQMAKDLFNAVWTLLEREDRSSSDDLDMIHQVHASCYHWSRVGTAVHAVRGEWQCSRVYSVLRLGESAVYHARRALQVCEANEIGDFDLAFCYEALARAHAVSGDWEEVSHWMHEARAAVGNIAKADDRELVTSDLETVPAPPRGLDGRRPSPH